jgi:hypothetical protein
VRRFRAARLGASPTRLIGHLAPAHLHFPQAMDLKRGRTPFEALPDALFPGRSGCQTGFLARSPAGRSSTSVDAMARSCRERVSGRHCMVARAPAVGGACRPDAAVCSSKWREVRGERGPHECRARRPSDLHAQGGCWATMTGVEPPCDDDSYAWKGRCYAPLHDSFTAIDIGPALSGSESVTSPLAQGVKVSTARRPTAGSSVKKPSRPALR